MTASAAKIDQCTPGQITSLVCFSRHQVYGVNQVFTRDQSGRRGPRSINCWASAPSKFRIGVWNAMICNVVEAFAVVGIHHPKIGSTKAHRLFQHCPKDWGEV